MEKEPKNDGRKKGRKEEKKEKEDRNEEWGKEGIRKREKGEKHGNTNLPTFLM